MKDRKKYLKEWRKNNPDKIKEHNKKYYQKNKEYLHKKKKKYNKEYNQRHEVKTRSKLYMKEYRKKKKNKIKNYCKEYRHRPWVEKRQKEYNKEYYQNNKDLIKKRQNQHYQKNEKKIKEYSINYRKNNPDKRKETNKKYYEKNPDIRKKYYQHNTKDIKKHINEYRKKYPEKIKKINKKWRKKNNQLENQKRIELSKKTGIKIPLIGEKDWLSSETKLYAMIKALCKGYTIKRHKTFSWLGRQHIDIYIQKFKTGIEYDGMQHKEFYSLLNRQNLNKFLKQLERDQRKDKLCNENNLHLIRWDYKTPVTEQNVIKLLTNLQIPINQDVLINGGKQR